MGVYTVSITKTSVETYNIDIYNASGYDDASAKAKELLAKADKNEYISNQTKEETVSVSVEPDPFG